MVLISPPVLRYTQPDPCIFIATSFKAILKSSYVLNFSSINISTAPRGRLAPLGALNCGKNLLCKKLPALLKSASPSPALYRLA